MSDLTSYLNGNIRRKTMKVLIVYCHPSNNSFTYRLKEEFIRGLVAAGHQYEVSDLYRMNFNETLSENEYLREGFYDDRLTIPEDVLAEQKKINEADMITFIYPVFWTEAPAKLVGWIQRIFTFGFAYGDAPTMKQLDKALFLVCMGGNLNDTVRQEQVKAMKTVMLGDRISNRAKEKEMIVFDQMTREYGNEGKHEEGKKGKREENIITFLKKTYEIGYGL